MLRVAGAIQWDPTAAFCQHTLYVQVRLMSVQSIMLGSLMSACVCTSRPVGHAVEELAELVRRNRRSLSAAQRTLLAGIQL